MAKKLLMCCILLFSSIFFSFFQVQAQAKEATKCSYEGLKGEITTLQAITIPDLLEELEESGLQAWPKIINLKAVMELFDKGTSPKVKLTEAYQKLFANFERMANCIDTKNKEQFDDYVSYINKSHGRIIDELSVFFEKNADGSLLSKVNKEFKALTTQIVNMKTGSYLSILNEDDEIKSLTYAADQLFAGISTVEDLKKFFGGNKGALLDPTLIPRAVLIKTLEKEFAGQFSSYVSSNALVQELSYEMATIVVESSFEEYASVLTSFIRLREFVLKDLMTNIHNSSNSNGIVSKTSKHSLFVIQANNIIEYRHEILAQTIDSINGSLEFKDITADFWASKEISFLSNLEIIKGNEDGNFKPNAEVTRTQAAVMIARALNLNLANRPDPKYSDVPQTHWAYKEIAAIVDEGIWSGDSKFKPNSPLLRYEMAMMLEEAYNLKGRSEKEFSDVSKTHIAYNQIQALVANNVTTGVSEGIFNPQGKLTRAQFSVFMARVLDDSFR